MEEKEKLGFLLKHRAEGGRDQGLGAGNGLVVNLKS